MSDCSGISNYNFVDPLIMRWCLNNSSGPYDNLLWAFDCIYCSLKFLVHINQYLTPLLRRTLRLILMMMMMKQVLYLVSHRFLVRIVAVAIIHVTLNVALASALQVR